MGKHRLAFCLFGVLVANLLLLGFNFDRTWVPHDDGYLAHVAERVASGEVLHADVQSRHGDYVHFLHALAFRVFGSDILHLRYFLIPLMVVQSLLLFFLLLPFSLLLACFASLLIQIFGYIQFLTPAPNWYCLFLTVCLIFFIQKTRSKPGIGKIRLAVIGFLLALMLMIRQLTAVFSCIGIFSYLLLERSDEQQRTRGTFSRLLIVSFFLVLVLYLIKTSDPLSFVLFGFFPLLLLIWTWKKVNVRNHDVILMIRWMFLGLVLGVLPLLIYHVWNRSLIDWFVDLYLRSSAVLDLMPYRSWSSYLYYIWLGFKNGISGGSLSLVLNGWYWFLLPLVSVLNGSLFLALILRRGIRNIGLAVLPFVAIFYSLVSHTLQIPIYLYYSAGLSLVSVLYLLFLCCRRMFQAGLLMASFLGMISVFFHAGQPALRGAQGIVAGSRPKLYFAGSSIDRLNVYILQDYLRTYESLTGFIQSHSSTEDSIFVFPNNPEIYFLSRRKNPFKFHFSSMFLQSQADLTAFFRLLEAKAPALVVYHKGDKYNTVWTLKLCELLQRRYRLIQTVDDFEIYELL